MDNLHLSQGGSFALNSGALAAGTTAGTIKTTAIINFTVDGAFYSKPITDNIALAVTLPATYGVATNGSFTGDARKGADGVTTGSVRLYGLYFDKTGAVKVWPGAIVNAGDLANGTSPLQFPGQRKGLTFFGALRVAVTAGTTFIPGTTALNAAGVTASYLNYMAIPAEPLLA